MARVDRSRRHSRRSASVHSFQPSQLKPAGADITFAVDIDAVRTLADILQRLPPDRRGSGNDARRAIFARTGWLGREDSNSQLSV